MNNFLTSAVVTISGISCMANTKVGSISFLATSIGMAFMPKFTLLKIMTEGSVACVPKIAFAQIWATRVVASSVIVTFVTFLLAFIYIRAGHLPIASVSLITWTLKWTLFVYTGGVRCAVMQCQVTLIQIWRRQKSKSSLKQKWTQSMLNLFLKLCLLSCISLNALPSVENDL